MGKKKNINIEKKVEDVVEEIVEEKDEGVIEEKDEEVIEEKVDKVQKSKCHKIIKINSRCLNLRTGPGYDFKIAKTIEDFGGVYSIDKEQKDKEGKTWAHITNNNVFGYYGWVCMDYCEFMDDNEDKISKFLKEANNRNK